MAKQINPVKKRIVKRALRAGKGPKEATLEAGYTNATAINAWKLSVVRRCQEELKREFKKEDITVEQILKEWETLRLTAIEIGDYRLAKDISDSKAKWLDMLSNGVTTQVNVYSQTPEDKKSLADIKSRVHSIPDKVAVSVPNDTIEPDTPKDSDDKEL